MGNFLLRQLLTAIPVLLGVVVATFVLMRLLPGDPAAYLATTPGMGPAEIAKLREEIGTDRSVPEQLVIYLSGLASGDLGKSIVTGRPVADDIRRRLPATLEVIVFALVLTVMLGVPLGVTAALWANTPIDHGVRFLTAASGTMPSFVTGLLLIFVFFYLLGWVPEPIGRLDPFITPPSPVTNFYLVDSAIAWNAEQFSSSLGQLLLPAGTMVLFALSPIARVTRAAMMQVLGSDYIRTARALGLPTKRLLISYALRNASISIVTTLGVVVSFLLGVDVLVEKLFAWPGIGSYALDGLLASDYGPVQGFVLVVAIIVVLVNLTVDALYMWIDPRVRFDE